MKTLEQQTEWLGYCEKELKEILQPVLSIEERSNALEDIRIYTGFQELQFPWQILEMSSKQVLFIHLARTIASNDAEYKAYKI